MEVIANVVLRKISDLLALVLEGLEEIEGTVAILDHNGFDEAVLD